MVTLCATIGARKASDKSGEAGARAVRQSQHVIGVLTALEVMLTMRPNLRAIVPSTVALMSSIGVSMLASMARSQSARYQPRKSPGGGPPAFVTTMSNSRPGPPGALNTAARPSGVGRSRAGTT